MDYNNKQTNKKQDPITLKNYTLFLNNGLTISLREWGVPNEKRIIKNYTILFSFLKKLGQNKYGTLKTEGCIFFELDIIMAQSFFNVLLDVSKNGEDALCIKPIKIYKYDNSNIVNGIEYKKAYSAENDNQYGIICYKGLTQSDGMYKNFSIQYSPNRKITLLVNETGTSKTTNTKISKNLNLALEMSVALSVANLGLTLCQIGNLR